MDPAPGGSGCAGLPFHPNVKHCVKRSGRRWRGEICTFFLRNADYLIYVGFNRTGGGNYGFVGSFHLPLLRVAWQCSLEPDPLCLDCSSVAHQP